MSGQQFATILARTDPFDVAQGVERHIRSLSGPELRAWIRAAEPRLNDWYRAEFLPLADEPDEERLRSAFAHSLKSNLRAIPLFGPNFCEGVISKIPGDRTVGLGEEGFSGMRMRPVAYAIIAVALLIGGAAAQHVLSTARANANTPVVLLTPEPALAAATAKPHVIAAAPRATTPPATAPPATAPPAPPQPAVHVAAAPPVSAPVVRSRPAAVRAHASTKGTPPPGRGALTVVDVPQRDPNAQATPVDTTDMPQAYSDATPLPANATAAPAEVSTSVRVPTPTPAPNRYWLHSTIRGTLRTLNNFNPFKHRSAPQPTSSPYGPQQP